MSEPHIAFAKDGFELKRVFLPTLGAVDTKWDANNPKDFINKSALKRGTIGDLMDKSKELSEKREKSRGRDEIKEKIYDDYAKSRPGHIHPDKKKEQLKDSKKKLSDTLKKLL